MPQNPIRIGIIGFGRIGAEHATWLSRADHIRAVAVADVTPARADLARQRQLRVYTTVEQLLGDREVDAVLVATPTAMHFHHAMLALGANKHVMVEKPMALDLEQAARMTREAQERGLVLCVFQNRRWDLDYLTLRRAVQENVFGKIINVESRLGQWSSCVGPAAREYHPNWRNEAEYGGGALYDWGSHFIDQIWRLLWPAKPVRVFAQLRGNVWSKDCDDFARVCIDFDSGSAAMVEINTTTTRPLPRWHVDGTTGSATSPHSAEFDVRTWAQFEYTPANHRSPRRLDPSLNEVNTESQLWTQFARAIESKAPRPIRPQSVLCTMALLDAARQSSQQGKTIGVQSAVDWIY